MSRIYFDNAATTALDPQVLESMLPYLTEKFGNPSSIYSYGRESKLAIEQARKSVAKILNAHPSETGLDNWKFDYKIANVSDLFELKQSVLNVLKHAGLL